MTRSDLQELVAAAGHDSISISAMFFPKDKQNVPVTVRLLKALVGFMDPSMNNVVQPTMLPQLIRARLIGSAMQGLLAPLINLDCSISELLVLISMTAHILFFLFRTPGAGTKFMQSVLYYDYQAFVQTVYWNVIKIQLSGKEQDYHIHQQGTDAGESMFGHMRTLTHNRNFNLAEANVNLSTAHQISHILEEHPEWSRGHRRLNATEDKVNPLSWRGDMKVNRFMNIPALYNQGMLQAKAAILASGLVNESSPDLDFYNLAAKGFSLRCPHGEWVGVTLMDDEVEDSDCDEDLDNGDEALPVSQPAHDEVQEEEQAFDDAAVTMEDACTEAAAFVKHPNTIIIEGKQVHKSTALRLGVSLDPKSMDRLRRVAGASRFTGGDVDLEDWHLKAIFLVRDPYAVLVSCGGVHALAVFRADLLQVPTARGGLLTVSNLTPDQLIMEAAQVTGSLMNLVYEAGSESERDSSFTWNGAVGAQVKVPANRIATFAAHASVRSSSIVATCKTSTLDAIFGSMLQLEGGQTSQVVKLCLKMTESFPYRGDVTNPWPLCNGMPQEQIAQEPRPISSRDVPVKCEVIGCGKEIKLSAMRLHIGAHILRGHCAPANCMTPLNAEACGFCGKVCLDRNSGVCKVDLVHGANKTIHLVESNCPFAYKISYRAVEKGSVANPCTNRPVPCQICSTTTGTIRHYVWSYHFLDHMESMHPGQKLTKEEVRKYAIRKDEYLGVLGKEYRAMEQEKRLKIDLARLKDDAASVTNPSLFWSRVLAG